MPGQHASVYIKNLIPERMKIKLVIIDSYKGELPSSELKYFVDVKKVEHIDIWKYSPEASSKKVETVFN